MRVLLVDVGQSLLQGLRARLGRTHDVVEVKAGDPDDTLLDPDSRPAADADVVIHQLSGATDADGLLRATLGTWSLLRSLRPGSRYLQLSAMTQFAGYDPGWQITETWGPRPDTDVAALAVHLGELTSRELSRNRVGETLVLRLDRVVDAERFTTGPVEPDWLHVDDAVAAIAAGVEAPTTVHQADPRWGGPHAHGHWRVAHVVRGTGRFPLTSTTAELLGRPQHRGPAPAPAPIPVDAPAWPAVAGPVRPGPPPRRITVYGAGGPLGVVTADSLDDRTLRLTDRDPLAVIASRPPQSAHAPQPGPVRPPHEERQVDVTDRDQVWSAAEGADCLVNVSVHRVDVATAFRVNLLGAWHVMTAAVEHGITRVVHTGPATMIAPYPSGHEHDRACDGRGPHRPGDWVYTISKLLGQEVCRLLAERHAIACPVLVFTSFADPAHGDTFLPRERQLGPYAVSWADAGRAMAAAADVAELPEPSPVIDVMCPSPHDRHTGDVAGRLLGWSARDRLDHHWSTRPPTG